MFISKDKKILILCVPKTGSNSIHRVFLEYGVANTYNHETFSDYCKLYSSNSSLVEKVYVFWRDPIERFLSAINFIRTDHNIIRDHFNTLTTLDCMNGVQISDTIRMIENMKSVTPEEIFNNKKLMEIVHFHPQSKWYKDIPEEKLCILNFSNFESHIKNILSEFGSNKEQVIPKLYSSIKLTAKLSPELEAAVREYYAEDYVYKPTH